MLHSRKTYYSIREVCAQTGLEPHVLRYWESEFPLLRPKKNRAGNRAYREKDIETIFTIKHLLYEELYTIQGANKKLQQVREEADQNPPDTSVNCTAANDTESDFNSKDIAVKDIINDLREILSLLKNSTHQ